jgi:hypothetical protein
MRHNNPLALSEGALKLVTRVAGRLPVERRSAFLSALAARLGEGEISYHAVELAIEAALDRLPASSAPVNKEKAHEPTV